MIPKIIAGANANPGAPNNWDPAKDGDCGRLAIRAVCEGNRVISCESAWEPTPKELDMLKAGGLVVLHIAGWQVPVSLRVEPRETAE